MYNSADPTDKPDVQQPVVETTGGADLRPPGRARVRRRLVQSTLFPHRSPANGTESAVKEVEDCDEVGDDQDDEEDEEYCGSQGKKKKGKRKSKATPKSRGSKKDTVIGKESSSERVINEDSPVISGSNFFLKVSERRHQKRQQKEHPCFDLPENTNLPPYSAANMKSPGQPKLRANATPKKMMTTTPKKNLMTSDPKEAFSGQMSINPIWSEQPSQPIPDLRLEAKMMAEEDSRIFAGRQIHPFFSSWKMGKKNQEATDMEHKWCSVEKKGKNITFCPIHVYEKDQDDAMSLDWGNWIFSETFSTSCRLEGLCSPVHGRYVKSLQFDNFLNVSYPTGMSLLQDAVSSDQCSIEHREVSLNHSPLHQEDLHAISPTPLADDQVIHCGRSNNSKMDNEMHKVDSLLGHASYLRNSDVEWQGRMLPERMMSCNHGFDNQPENSLWAKKYQPEKATEVCGNGESVKILSEWLHLWHKRGFRTSKNSIGCDKQIVQDVDCNSYQSDSDFEGINEEISLKNVLLVTGPVGSGKSAAIYACAKEQGFKVIEVNASDWRNGALMKQRFQEAVGSHGLQCTLENPVNSENEHLSSSFAAPNLAAAHGSCNEVIDLVPISDEEDSLNSSGMPAKSVFRENRTTSDQSEIRNLILFEDVDVSLNEDHGFVATIQQLAETAKWPMILTSNRNNPVLPNNLDRLEVSFTIPSLKELLHVLHMICAAEKANLQPCLVERFIGYCRGDIRKTIMHLQFWCQGPSYRKNSEVQSMYAPLLFDLDAGYRMLPKIIPWGCPSQLSELVENEITKSLLKMEENSSLMEIVVEEELNNTKTQISSMMQNTDTSSIEAKKKEAMLSRHCSIQDGNEFASQFETKEFSSSSGSPVAFTRRNPHRTLDRVLSSDSEEECLSDRFPTASCKLFEDTDNDILLEVHCKSSRHCVAAERCFSPFAENLHSGEKLEENHCRYSKIADHSQFNVTCKSLDVSYVPESTFVPETEINDGTDSRTVSFGYAADRLTVSTSNNLIPNSLPVEGSIFDKFFLGLHKNPEIMGHASDEIMESIQGEVGDSHVEHVEAVPRRYQVMDECSRMDFSRELKTVENPLAQVVTDSVQKTWRKLRGCHMDLRHYVSAEQRDSAEVLKLASGMSNLISEADLLFSDCQPFICDSLKPSMFPCEESHSFNWYDDQLQMTSTIAQHGICFYAKEIAAIGGNMGSVSRVDLAWEMLVSSTSTMALGRLIGQDRRTIRSSEMGSPKSGISLKSELESCLCNIVQSIVPSRSYLALKGDSFHEYLSSLCQISRLETSRLSECINGTKRRRGRVARHYLSTGVLMVSPEDISLLGQYNSYGTASSKSMEQV